MLGSTEEWVPELGSTRIGVEVFPDRDFEGASQMLPAWKGSFGMADLNAEGGVGADTITSLRLTGGVRSVTLYAEDGCEGDSRTYTSNCAYVGDDFNDRTRSIRIEMVNQNV